MIRLPIYLRSANLSTTKNVGKNLIRATLSLSLSLTHTTTTTHQPTIANMSSPPAQSDDAIVVPGLKYQVGTPIRKVRAELLYQDYV